MLCYTLCEYIEMEQKMAEYLPGDLEIRILKAYHDTAARLYAADDSVILGLAKEFRKEYRKLDETLFSTGETDFYHPEDSVYDD